MDEVDVIILGTGAAGMTAALAAHEAGARVALVERYDRIGGTSAISGGVIWVADNPRMRAAGMADSRAAALAYFRSLDHGDLVDETLEAFVDKGPEALAFLEGFRRADLVRLGAAFEDRGRADRADPGLRQFDLLPVLVIHHHAGRFGERIGPPPCLRRRCHTDGSVLTRRHRRIVRHRINHCAKTGGKRLSSVWYQPSPQPCRVASI